MIRSFTLCLIAFVFPSCQQSSIDPAATAVVKDVRIPKDMPWYSRFASHSFVDFRSAPKSPWRRIEIVNKDSGLTMDEISTEEVFRSQRWGNPVRIVSQSKLDGHVLASQIDAYRKSYDDSLYRPLPGPNSNTFTGGLLQSVDGLSGVLDHNGVGKDFRWDAGPASGGSGMALQTPLVGMEVGVKEGLNLNLIGLSAGMGIWPPAIKLPFLPQFPLRPKMKPASPQR